MDNFDLLLEQIKIYQEIERLRRRKIILVITLAVVAFSAAVYTWLI